jgi:Ca2+-binding RTX toxin-like protein
VLLGGDGDDTLDGGSDSNDVMKGGKGNDWYTVDAGDKVVEAAGQGFDRVSSYAASYTLTTGVEQLFLQGGAVNGTGNALDNFVGGNGLDNILSGGAAGKDTLYGGAGNDVLYGGAGNDYLRGESGGDTMVGGAGNDNYEVENIGDVVVELKGGGIDLVGATVDTTLSANVENLVLLGFANINGTGNELANYITGNEANNTLLGATGTIRFMAAAPAPIPSMAGSGTTPTKSTTAWKW